MQNKGLQDNGKIFGYDYTVATYDCGYNCEIPVSRLLDLLEEAADGQLSAYHMSQNELLEIDTVFLLSAIEIKILRPLKRHEEINISTWQRKVCGVRYIRDGVITDSDGNEVARCVENWFIADPVRHRIKRPRELPNYDNLPFCPEKGFETEIISLSFPKESVFCGKRKIVYSDLDCNHHLHNTRYADIVMDFLRSGSENITVTGMKLIFSKEAVLGDEISIYTAPADGGILVRGVFDNGIKCFDAEVFTK